MKEIVKRFVNLDLGNIPGILFLPLVLLHMFLLSIGVVIVFLFLGIKKAVQFHDFFSGK